MGDTAWVLTSAALVLFMVPGLAFFYGGMVRGANVLNMLLMNMVCLGIVPIVWFVAGYSLSSADGPGGIIGNFDHLLLKDINLATMPLEDSLGVFFALTFAAITPALISGAVADRMKFGVWMAFVALWSLLVFVPTWAWIYGPDGWLTARGSLDFAGGTVVHVSAGAGALALTLVLGRRRGWPTEAMPPHNVTFVLLGAGILWFGWFGFNAGSSFAADGVAVVAFMNTFLAGAAAMLSWMVVERLKDGHFTGLGAASGIVAGLVAITPAAGFVGGISPILIGAAAGAICYFAIQLKFKMGYDDSLDVVGVHLVGGLVGGILIGLFAHTAAVGAEAGAFEEGLFQAGGLGLLIEQIFANGVVLVYSFVVTGLIAKALDATVGLRVDAETETVGLDRAMHAESAYSSGLSSGGGAALGNGPGGFRAMQEQN